MARRRRSCRCARRGCPNYVAAGRLLCAACWQSVPAETRRRCGILANERRWGALREVQDQALEALNRTPVQPAGTVTAQQSYAAINRITGDRTDDHEMSGGHFGPEDPKRDAQGRPDDDYLEAAE